MSNPRPSRDQWGVVRAGVAAMLLIALAVLPLSAHGVTRASGHAESSSPSTFGRLTGTRASSITTLVRDGDDTAGRLDIRTVRSRIDAASGRASGLQYVVRTYEAFRVSALHERWRRLVLELDTDGRPGSERNVRVSGHEGRLSADLISNATREVLARLSVRHPAPTVLRISGSRAQLGARKLFWTADWHRRGDPACGELDGWQLTCQDSVPDDGWLRLDRPAWP